MHDPTKLEALQIATAATVRHSYQGEQLLYQPMADVGRDPMGFAVGTPGLPKHSRIRLAAGNATSSSTQLPLPRRLR
jgi:hypothetical protein